MLTAARQGAVRRATRDEFDLASAVWTVPAEHMKRGRARRVPLSTGALAMLDEVRGLSGGGLAFRGPGGGELGKANGPGEG